MREIRFNIKISIKNESELLKIATRLENFNLALSETKHYQPKVLSVLKNIRLIKLESKHQKQKELAWLYYSILFASGVYAFIN